MNRNYSPSQQQMQQTYVLSQMESRVMALEKDVRNERNKHGIIQQLNEQLKNYIKELEFKFQEELLGKDQQNEKIECLLKEKDAYQQQIRELTIRAQEVQHKNSAGQDYIAQLEQKIKDDERYLLDQQAITKRCDDKMLEIEHKSRQLFEQNANVININKNLGRELETIKMEKVQMARDFAEEKNQLMKTKDLIKSKLDTSQLELQQSEAFKKELSEAEFKYTNLQQHNILLSNEVEVLKEKLSNEGKKYQNYAKTYSEQIDKINTCQQQELEKREQQIREQKVEIKSLQTSLDLLQKENFKFSQDNNTFMVSVKSLGVQVQQLSQNNDLLQQSLQVERDSSANIVQQRNNVETANAQLTSDAQIVAEELKRIRLDLSVVSAQKQNQERDKEEKSRECEHLYTRLEQAIEKLNQLNQLLDTKNSEVTQLYDKLHAQEVQFETNYGTMKEDMLNSVASIGQLRRQLIEEQTVKQQAQMELETVKARLEEQRKNSMGIAKQLEERDSIYVQESLNLKLKVKELNEELCHAWKQAQMTVHSKAMEEQQMAQLLAHQDKLNAQLSQLSKEKASLQLHVQSLLQQVELSEQEAEEQRRKVAQGEASLFHLQRKGCDEQTRVTQDLISRNLTLYNQSQQIAHLQSNIGNQIGKQQNYNSEYQNNNNLQQSSSMRTPHSYSKQSDNMVNNNNQQNDNQHQYQNSSNHKRGYSLTNSSQIHKNELLRNSSNHNDDMNSLLLSIKQQRKQRTKNHSDQLRQEYGTERLITKNMVYNLDTKNYANNFTTNSKKVKLSKLK